MAPTIFAVFLCILTVIGVGSRSDLRFAGDTTFLHGIEGNEVGFKSRAAENEILRKSSEVELDSGSKIAEKSILCCRKASFYSYSTLFSSPNTTPRLRFRIAAVKKRILSQESLNSTVLITGNSTLLSRNRTFELGFFSTDGGESNWYLGIWYSSIPIRTYVWVANREKPVKTLASATASLTDGLLTITDSSLNSNVWQTENVVNATEAKLLETGNLVLLDREGKVVWQSFDFPADTWLPGMNITRLQSLTCWKSESDPSLGNYSFRLKPLEYGEFELVFNGGEVSYWSSGNWTGKSFSGVPEMTVPYIYSFLFENPFTPEAFFLYTEKSPETEGLRPPLTRFLVDSSGQFRQYLWSFQTNNWDMFWSRPESVCRVYGLCGTLGFCKGTRHNLLPCECLAGFRPVDESGWNSGDYSGGCRRDDGVDCDENDGFVEVGPIEFDGVSAGTVSFPGDRSFCEATCLKNCSCVGLYRHNSDSSDECRILYGKPDNIRNLTAASTDEAVFYVRVSKGGFEEKEAGEKWRMPVVISCICGGFIAVLSFGGLVVVLILKKRKKRREAEEEAGFPVTNLKVFSYRELYAATQGFSEKLGHGGFGAVFRGDLPDSTPIAVKRLERPGGGEREFRAEVCTIGNIQHVNLVRLRGFCPESSHRLLVYDYMVHGPLSVFLRRDGHNLSWDVRFRVALGTARGIAYLHEECRDCIIHCDIKPENILLDEDFTAKVSDFGLAKLVCRDFSRILTTMRGTWGYVAPEWISGVAITPKADVYSYGMTLLEIIGGRRNVEAPPVSGTGTGIAEEKWFFPPWAAQRIVEGDVAGVVDELLAGEYDAAEAERAALVAVWCIQDEENGRPTMGTVVKMLEGTVEIALPPVPQLLQALVSGSSFAKPGNVFGKASSSSSLSDHIQNHFPQSDIT